jgi:PAS domain S-box-containing protein
VGGIFIILLGIAYFRLKTSLQRALENYRSLFENAAEGIIRTTPQGKFIAVNPAYAHMHGYDSPEQMIKNIQDIGKQIYVNPQDRKNFMMELDKKNIIKMRYEARCAKGGTIWVAAHARAMRNKKGEIIYYESIVEDITEQLRREEESKKQAEQLLRSNQELEQFAYILSHDLKEPLRMVSIYTELIQNELKEQATPKVSEYIQFTLEGSIRMQKMIGDLLHYSKIKGELNPFVEVDCNVVLGTVLEDLKSAIEESGASIVYDSLPTVYARFTQMCQLFQNVLANAIKFRGAKPLEIKISVIQRGTFWEFSVRDNGIGINKNYLDRVFIIFQRLHHSKKYPGTGIGLFICKRIVENFGGVMWVTSELGEGSTFYFTLPTREHSNASA